MRLSLMFAAAACAVGPTVSVAQESGAPNSEVTFGPLPDWVSVPELLPMEDAQRGLAFIRQQDTEIYLGEDGQTNFQSLRVRLLQPNSLQLGNISIVWNPSAGAPVVHSLKVHRDGTVRDVLSEAEFEILRREDNLEQAMLSGILTAVLRVPDLRVGDELEFAYSVPQQDPTLGPASFGLLFLGDSPPPGRYRLRLNWADGQEPNVKLTPDFEPLVTRSARSIEIDADMPGVISAPKDAPPRYSWQRIAEFSDFDSWQAISRQFEPLYRQASHLSANSAVKGEAERIAAAHSDPLARAAAALDLVQKQVRYIFVGLNSGNLKPASAEETWARRYGDCKGKTVLLLALLRELGIDAKAVLVNNNGGDDGLDQRLPNPGMFDHVLVRASIGDREYWLDGTLPEVVPPTGRPVLPYRWVLPLSAEGETLEGIPWQPADRPDKLVLFDIDARAGFDQPAELTTTYITRDLAALTEYVQLSSVTDEQLASAFRQNAEGGATWDTIGKVVWRFDEATQASVLTMSGSGPVDWQGDNSAGRYLTLPGGGFSPPERRQRGSDQDPDAPYYSEPEFSCHVTTVRLPADTDPQDWNYNTSFDTIMFGARYRRVFERSEGEITMLRQLRTLETEISPATAAQDNTQLAAFDNSMARITHYPGDPVSLTRQQSVPAAHEIDWVTDDDACLGPPIPTAEARLDIEG